MNIISGLSSLLAIGLLTPVQSILCLIILFTSTAISLYLNNFILLGILYILIYVGAIAILFLFILSLLKIEYTPISNISPITITLLIVTLIPLDIIFNNYNYNIIESTYTTYNELITVGNVLYTEYAYLLILIGIILILSVIGAIAITR